MDNPLDIQLTTRGEGKVKVTTAERRRAL